MKTPNIDLKELENKRIIFNNALNLLTNMLIGLRKKVIKSVVNNKRN